MLTKTKVFLIACLVFSMPALAGNLPAGYPDFFEHSGVINSINPKSGLINVGDIPLYMSPNVVIHTPGGQYMTLDNLQPGSKVGCTTHQGSNGSSVVDELWLLPKRSLPLGSPRH